MVVDEAHRLNAKSGMFKNMGENQIKEIINTAKVSIFFVDNNQRVTMNGQLKSAIFNNFYRDNHLIYYRCLHNWIT